MRFRGAVCDAKAGGVSRRRLRGVAALGICTLLLGASGTYARAQATTQATAAQSTAQATAQTTAQTSAQATAAATAAAPAAATDLVGAWQGTLMPPNAQRGTRVVIKVAKSEGGGYKAALYNADQGAPPLTFDKVTVDGQDVRLANPMITIEGKLSADGNSIDAKWTGGPNSIPISLARATADTAWALPEPLKPMAADADPAFEVATIKPNNSGATQMQGLVMRGRQFLTRASSLEDLIAFAYNLQAKQVVGGPDWMAKDRYDIEALPDAPGVPNAEQVRVMIRKLLADRFELKFHKEQREMSAYVLEVGKGGQKLTPNESKGPLPGLGFSPGPTGLTLRVMNATMGDFTGFLQVLVLDRPVVDRTALTGRYDFKCTFTPDDSQFNGHPPRLPATGNTEGGVTPAADVAAAPSLYEAIQEELGLKLTSEKTNVDVIAIDHVEPPSAN